MKTLNRMDVVKRLRAAREELGLDKRDMAARLGVTREAYYNWEAEDPKKPNFPSPTGLIAACRALKGLTLDYLYTGRLDNMPVMLAIKLTAREMGLNPDEGETNLAPVLAKVAAAAHD